MSAGAVPRMGGSNDERHSGHVDVAMADPDCPLCGLAEAASPALNVDMITAALKATLAVYDARIGWAGAYDHGDPPTIDAIAKGIAARLPL